MLRLLPLVVAVAFFGFFVTARFSERIDALLTRVAFVLFGGRTIEHDIQRERLLRSAAIGTSYREYAAKTYLYSIGAAISGVIIGLYVGVATVVIVRSGEIDPRLLDLMAIDGVQFGVVLFASIALGVAAAGGAYALRWRIPAIRADARRRQIEASLPRMVAFTYALTRGGMSFPDVLRTLAANEGVFGEGATEVDTAVRNLDLFNVDLVTAIQDLSDSTPSEQFSSFSENLSSVLQSGGDISEFLHEQYERYRDEAEDQQAEILNLLATTAEVYVTVTVAGMLFLATILLIIGLTVGGTLRIMQLITYVVIPAANLLFLGYLLDITQPLRATRQSEQRSVANTALARPTAATETDGGYSAPGSEANHERLNAYRGIQSIQETLTAPVASVIARPRLLLYVTIPIAVFATAYRFPSAIAEGSVDVQVLDDLLVQAALFLMGTFAVVYEYRKHRLRRLEAAVPDFLDRLASLNEAGISIVSSLDRLRRSDVGALDAEVDRIWRDVTWGATAETALSRFESRVRTPSITRVVTLITNAMRASNEIGPVLRIAADQARSDLQLRRQRRQEMFTYLVVIYVSFLVFLIVIVALESVLIPSLPDVSEISDGVGGTALGSFGGLEGSDRETYRLVFFHTALIQSALSGLVAGVMGSGSIKDGMKHSTVMLSITYVVLAVL